MSVPKRLVIFISVILLVACETTPTYYWVKNGASVQDYNQNNYQCLQESQQQSSNAYIGTSYSEASSGTVTNWLLYDSCMKARGWSKKIYIQK